MNQTGLTFVLSEDGLQASPLCFEQATGLYYVAGEPPTAQGEFGSVYRRFYSAAGGFKPGVLREVLLPVGGTLCLEEEYSRLCAVSNIPGTVKVVQRPLYSATHGYFLTQFITGESLAVHLANDRRASFTGSSLNVHRKMHALQQLCLTLFEVHAAGIIHRDIKSENVIVCEAQGSIQLVGFGLAEVSSTGMVKGSRGSLQYMGPEELLQHRHALLTARLSGSNEPDDSYELDGQASDLFALGLVAFQYLTECFPFPQLMTPQEYHQFLMLDSCVQLEILAVSYQNWTVAGWADNDDPRWACLWDCTKDPAVFQFVRHLLAPMLDLRLQNLRAAPFMHQVYNAVSHASLLEMPLPLRRLFKPAKALAEAGVVLSNGVTFFPVPGMATVLWDPCNPMFDTITGTLYRCFITPDHSRMFPHGPHAHPVGPALLKATDLLNLQFLRLPLHYNGINFLRATALACHLNKEAAMLSNMCQHSAAASPAAHLHQDVQYSILRLPGANPRLWPESIQRVMQDHMKDGDSIHPHGMQRLAIRLLKVFRQAHLGNSAIGLLTPAVVFLAPEAFLADVSYSFLPSWGCSEEYMGPVLSSAVFMAPETIRALQGCPLPDEPAVSPAADMFSLGALLKALMLGRFTGHATILSTLQQEAWDFANSLMAGPIAERPSADQALCSPFLSPASVRSAAKEMQLLLPHFCWDQDLLPIMPLGLPSQEVEDGFTESELIVVDNSWAPSALHASSAPPDNDTSAMPDQAAYADADADANVSVPADNIHGVGSSNTSSDLRPAAHADADANVSVPADNIQGVGSLNTSSDLIPAAYAVADANVRVPADNIHGVGSSNTSSDLRPAAHADADANVSVPADNIQGVGSLNTSSDLIPAAYADADANVSIPADNIQGVGSSNTSSDLIPAAYADADANVSVPADNIQGVGSSNTSSDLRPAAYAVADANVSVPADNIQGVGSSNTSSDLRPAANAQDLGSSRTSKQVILQERSQPAVPDGRATFSMGSTAPHRQVPQQSRLRSLFTPVAPSSLSSSLGSEDQSPTLSTRANTAAQAEQQAESQHSTQPLSLQHGLADSSSNTTGLRPHDELMSLQAFVDTKLCGGCVHPHGIQLLAKQFLKVLADLHAKGCSMGVLHPEAVAMTPAAQIAYSSFGTVNNNDWAHAMGPVEHMAPETLKAVLKQPLSADEGLVSPAADMFSLGVLLKGLALGYLPFKHSKRRSCTLGSGTAVKRAKSIVKQHRQWQGCDGAQVNNLSMLGQQAVAFVNSLMSVDPSARPSAEASLGHPFLSRELMTEGEADMRRCLPGYCQQRDILPLLPKASATTAAVPSAASVQAATDGQPPGLANSLHPAAVQQDTVAEPAPFSGLLTQPTAFAYTESQKEEQQWMDLFLEAWLAQDMQPDHDAAVKVALSGSPSSSEQQPVEAPLRPLDVPADAGSLQRWMSHDFADGEEALGPDTWLTAFAQAHMYTSLCSMQHADSDLAF